MCSFDYFVYRGLGTLWVWVFSMILTFCRCCLVVFICIYLLVRLLVWFILFYMFISFLIPVVTLLIRKGIKYLEFSVGVFECGFDSYNVRVLPISLRFFIFCIIFLVLDLELIIVSLRLLVVFYIGFILGIFVFFVIGYC